jgi:AcrR family transcriptional regulator
VGPPAVEAVRRADAQRNRKLLLEAAAEAFAAGGIDVSAGEIARRAGVAKGTLFRHFPTKSDLVAAVLIDRMAQLRGLIGEIGGERPAGLAAVAEIMRRGAELLASDRSFFDAAMAHAENDDSLQSEKLALEAALEGLVAAARAAGEVRDDVRGIDVAMLMMAATNTCAPTQHVYPDLWRRYLALMTDGLRPGAVTPLPVPPVHGAEMRTALARQGARRPA